MRQGVTQTEDWVKIAGHQLAPKNGAYDIRISAELWETHFVDHVSLMVVDHPDDVEVFVDERSIGRAPITGEVVAVNRGVIQGVVDGLRRALQWYGVPGSAIRVELTERSLLTTSPAVKESLERMAEIVRKIGKITRYETKTYVGNATIIDLDRSSVDPNEGLR